MEPQPTAATLTPPVAKQVKSGASKKKKLGYREQQELEQLPEKIDALEQRQQALTVLISDPSFYQQDAKKVDATVRELDQVSKELDHCLERWSELES
jgi:ATP-binding cassette subfamily F protein uup